MTADTIRANIIKRRAQELEDAGRGTAHRSGIPNLTPSMIDIAFGKAGEKTAIINKKVECRQCYNEQEIPASADQWVCEVCGERNTI